MSAPCSENMQNLQIVGSGANYGIFAQFMMQASAFIEGTRIVVLRGARTQLKTRLFWLKIPLKAMYQRMPKLFLWL